MPKRNPRPPAIAGAPAARRKTLTVALLTRPNRWLRAEAQARGWRLVHLEYCNYILPAGLTANGALVDLPTRHPRIRVLLPKLRAVVRIGTTPSPEDERVPCILPDQAAEGRGAAEHFAERGFRHVGYVGSRPLGLLKTLFESFRERAAELGMACHLFQVPVDGIGEDPFAAMAKKQDAFTGWLRTLPRPVGLLAPTDARAARYCAWAIEAGFNLPAEVALLGRGNQADVCESMMPSLSSVDPNDEAQVRAACDLLARLMAGERPPGKPIVVPPAGIVERESTHLLAVPDPDVAAALRYLWDRLDQNLSVNGVADAVGVSRRKLERAFRRHLQRGINDELRRKRLEEFCRLLRTTDHSVTDLAPAVGFRNLTNLYKAFHAAHGMTPGEFRMRNAE